jgi:hypothetical protein
LAWHGFSRAPLPKIISEGLLLKHAEEGSLLASALYGSSDIRYSFTYYTDHKEIVADQKRGKVLLTRMLLGKVHDLKPGQTLDNHAVNILKNKLGCHSTSSCTTDRGNSPIYAVYEDNQIDIVAVVELSITGESISSIPSSHSTYSRSSVMGRQSRNFMHIPGLGAMWIGIGTPRPSTPTPTHTPTPTPTHTYTSPLVKPTHTPTPTYTPTPSTSSTSMDTEDVIQTVINQTNCTRQQALQALHNNNSNLVDAILSLTE